MRNVGAPWLSMRQARVARVLLRRRLSEHLDVGCAVRERVEVGSCGTDQRVERHEL